MATHHLTHHLSIDSIIKDDTLKEEGISSSPASLTSVDPRSAEKNEDYSHIHDVEKQLLALAQRHTFADPTLTSDGPSEDPSLVGWDEGYDPENPMQWPLRRKVWMSLVPSYTTLIVSITSSIWSEDVEVTAKEFHTSREVMILGVSLYVLGFACGPLVFGPISELYGRSRPIIFGFLCFSILQIPIAVATNLQTILVCRFLSAALGAATFSIAPGILVDLWEPYARGIASLLWCMTVFAGPTVGPLVASYTVENPSLGWRWTAWLMLIVGMALWVISMPTISETYAPIILQRKAARLRVETRNWALHSKRDEDPITYKYLALKYGLKPLQMLVQEPILACMTVFMSLVYAMIYLMFVAYPYSFETVRGWDLGTASLPFIGLFVGYVLACLICIFESTVRFRRLVKQNDGTVAPEERLPVMILGSVILIIGLFWFAWTSSPSINWAPQVVAGVFIGAGIFLIFVPGQVYLMDVYTINAASALAGNAFVRAALACAFPLIGDPMYDALGVDWAMSLLGFLCLALTPFPILFYMFGPKVRSWSKYAPQD